MDVDKRVRDTHRHNPASFGLLKAKVINAFRVAGVEPDLAAQSWHIFGNEIVRWLGGEQQDHDNDGIEPRFDVFLDTLLRGLPARTPPEHPRPRRTR